ncbi:MAG: tetratricopeptide repeat protein [Spirochaetales bacterium]|nr:tetratricopeptide repeat protein [Spirochaetales bacterium]
MDLLQEAIEAGRKRNYKKAIQLLSRLIYEGEDNQAAFFYLGRAYHATGDYGQAIQCFMNVSPVKEPAVDFFLGRSYLNAELYEGAVFHFSRLYKSGNFPLQLYPFLGMALFKLRKYSHAHTFFEKAIVHFPDDKRIFTMYQQNLFILGIRAFRNEQYEEAEEIFLFLLKSGMEHISLLLYCGFIYEEFGRYTLALEYYRKAAEMEPEDTALKIRIIDCLFKTGEIKTAEELLHTINRKVDLYIDRQNLNMTLAEFYYDRKDYRRAMCFAVRELKKSGHSVDVHLLLGVCYREIEQYEISRNHFTRVLDIDRSNLQALWGLLTAFWLENDWNGCLEVLNRIARNYPDDEVYRYYLPLVGVKLGKPSEDTIPVLEQLSKQNPDDPYIMIVLGEEYIKSDRIYPAYQVISKAAGYESHRKDALKLLVLLSGVLDKKDEQIKLYDQYLRIAEEDNRSRYDFIQLLVRVEQYKKAIPEIETLLPLPEYRKRILPLLAFCKRKTNAWAESGVLYKQLLRNNPENENYLQSLVYCMVKLKKKDTALELMRKAEKFLDFSSDLYLILGVLYFKNDNDEMAMQTFKNCLDKFPDDWRIYNNISKIYKKRGLHTYASRYSDMAARIESGN